MSLAKSNIAIILPPRSHIDTESWDRLTEKLKEFRLHSLRESPEAFSSTYAREIAFTKDIWASRLSNPLATILIAIETDEIETFENDAAKIQALLDHDWCATTALIRPQHNNASKLSASSSPWMATSGNVSVSEKVLLILNGVYVAPSYRHAGIGSAIVRESFRAGEAIAKAKGISQVHFQVRVDSANSSAVKLYEKCEFVTGSKEELRMGWKEKEGVVLPPRDATIFVMDRWVSVS